jgi:hypothetical protein
MWSAGTRSCLKQYNATAVAEHFSYCSSLFLPFLFFFLIGTANELAHKKHGNCFVHANGSDYEIRLSMLTLGALYGIHAY